jgi:hypothetical protein
MNMLFASPSVLCPGIIPQKQGAAQSIGSSNRVLIVSLACLGSSVAGGVKVVVGVERGVEVGADEAVGGTSVSEGICVSVTVGGMGEVEGTQPKSITAKTNGM